MMPAKRREAAERRLQDMQGNRASSPGDDFLNLIDLGIRITAEN